MMKIQDYIIWDIHVARGHREIQTLSGERIHNNDRKRIRSERIDSIMDIFNKVFVQLSYECQHTSGIKFI